MFCCWILGLIRKVNFWLGSILEFGIFELILDRKKIKEFDKFAKRVL